MLPTQNPLPHVYIRILLFITASIYPDSTWTRAASSRRGECAPAVMTASVCGVLKTAGKLGGKLLLLHLHILGLRVEAFAPLLLRRRSEDQEASPSTMTAAGQIHLWVVFLTYFTEGGKNLVCKVSGQWSRGAIYWRCLIAEGRQMHCVSQAINLNNRGDMRG